jgi:hypothetical protein
MLLADTVRAAAERVGEAVEGVSDPTGRLRRAVHVLFEAASPEPGARPGLRGEVIPRLAAARPDEACRALEPLLALLSDLMVQAGRTGLLRPGLDPHRAAGAVVHTTVFLASCAVPDLVGGRIHLLTADEVWDFCVAGVIDRPA